MVIYILGGPEHGQQQRQTRKRTNSHTADWKIGTFWAIKTIDGPISLDRNQSVCVSMTTDDRFDGDANPNARHLRKLGGNFETRECNADSSMWWLAISEYVPVFCLVYNAVDGLCLSTSKRNSVVTEKCIHLSAKPNEWFIYLSSFVLIKTHCRNACICECVRLGRCIKLNK